MKAQNGIQLLSNTSAESDSSHPVSITQLLNVSPVLPGESAELYQSSLRQLIHELEAKTVLQVYIAEKIHECLWWMRRYEQQKRLTLIDEMASFTNSIRILDRDDRQDHLLDCLLRYKLDTEALEFISSKGYTVESLLQKAIERKRGEISAFNNQIASQAKVLAGFQASYEVAFNRKFHADTLRMQNEIMSRDLSAINGK